MRSVKSLSYKQITEHAEKSMRSSMKLAAEAEDDADKRKHKFIAFGAYNLWFALTRGLRNEDDDKRLRAISGY